MQPMTWLEKAQENMRLRYKQTKKPKPAARIDGFGCVHTGGPEPCSLNRKGACRTKTKLRYLERRYGITRAELLDLLAWQDKRCALCRQPFKLFMATGTRKAGWVPDHCHKTGKVRGLLCHNCNVKIGLFGDNPDELERAAAYLRKHTPSC